MAPFKFEEDIKSVLEKRTIRPSKMAWAELEKSLDTASGNAKNKSFWWFGIAASVVGILWVSISFFNQEKGIVEPIIVEVANENIEIPTEINSNQKADKIIKKEVIGDKSIISNSNELVAAKAEPKTIKKETIPITEKNIKTASKFEELVANEDNILPNTISEEEKQLHEVAAQIAALEKENATDLEIDDLLKSAQQKIADQKFKESGMSVSAYALLFDVEEELDPTFKEKVFNILSENYQSVKNAVAQRND